MKYSRQRHGEEGEAGHERWLVSYADFITLMFAFFAVLYATSEKDLSKSREFQESIKRFLIKAGGSAAGGDPQVRQADKHATAIEPPIQTFQRSKPESEQILTQTEQLVEAKFTPAERNKYIQDVGADEWGVRIVVNAGALFPEGREKFKAEALPFVNGLGEILARAGSKILIEGHVAKGEKGAYASTWHFASARAINFLRFLQAGQKLRMDQLAVSSYADSRPLYTDAPRSAFNSRLEIVVLNPDLD
jgi:chemotaxis protein MotB